MKNLYLIRGVPGAGKSTLASQLGGAHFEADQYFFNENSEYVFDAAKLKDAHNWCRLSVMDAMTAGEPTVVVSNTFTQEWEMDAYYQLAEELGYRVFSIIVENRHGGKNIHGAPDDKVQQMRERFQIKL